MKYPGQRGGKTTNSTNNVELPPPTATFCITFFNCADGKKWWQRDLS